jgi:protein SCO1/2
MTKNTKVLIIFFVATISAAVFFFLNAKPSMEELKKSVYPAASLYPEAKSVSDKLNFIDDTSKDIHLSDITDGKWALLYFGYTSCPDVCPIDLSKISQASQLMENSDKLQVVFVSVDPARDLGNLDNFAKAFNPSFKGLTAQQDELMSVSKTLGVYHEVVQSQKTAQEDHSNHNHSHDDHSENINNDFNFHKMINKATGDIQNVKTHEKHLELMDLGYAHYEDDSHDSHKMAVDEKPSSTKVAHYDVDHTSSYLLFNPELKLVALLTNPHEPGPMSQALDKIIEALGKN